MVHDEPPGVGVALIGLRGSGKSTLGPGLSAALGFDFIDTDVDVLDRFQEGSFVEVLRVHGEAAWRAAEIDVARDLLARPDQVVAMGGGMPIIPDVQSMMHTARAEGELIVIYLAADPMVLEERLEASPGDRASLSGRGLVEEIRSLSDDRDPVYRALADIICPVMSEPAHETAARLASLVGGS